MISKFSEQQIQKIVEIAFDAGEIAAKSQFARDFQIMKKADNSKVTTSDIAVSKFINAKLTQEFPQIPLICEEGELRSAGDIFWLIDPIDGTSGFIEGSPEFAVNIALIENGKAQFGLIYAPLFEGGKMVFSNSQNQVITQNKSGEQKFLAFKKSPSDTLRIVTSPRTKDHDIENYVTQFRHNFGKNFVVERLSSAVKFFRIVENDADLYLHFKQSMEWDTAAGQALIEKMSGVLKTISLTQDGFLLGDDLSYKKVGFLNQSFITFIS